MSSSARAVQAGAVASLGVAAMIGLTYLLATLPARSIALGTIPPTVVYGGYHIHSTRSDGTGTVDDIAAAASRAGLGFVLLTDHGDAMRQPLAPSYRHGVLCLDAVEINTTAGHVVAIGLTTPSPYPLAGEAAGVIDDIHRQGGWAVIAHPDSPKDALAWHDWTVPYDGVEWLNADAEWRGHSALTLAGAAARSLFRGPESVALLFRRPAVTLARWDEASHDRRIVGLAGLDAHARGIGWHETSGDGSSGHTFIALPSYEEMFRALAQAVVLDAPLSGDAARDSARVLGALRAGHTFSIVRAMASPASLEFTAVTSGETAAMGDAIAAGASTLFRARVPQAPGSRLALLCDGLEVASGRGSLSYSSPGRQTSCRVEVNLPGRSMPWIVSNPIALAAPPTSPATDEAPDAGSNVLALLDRSRWNVERDPASTADIAADGRDLAFSFSLGSGHPAGQYAAISAALSGDDSYDRVRLTARADRPLRLWVQVRLPGGKDGLRWERSFYLDRTPRTVVLPLKKFAPVDRPSGLQPVAVHLRSLLFVVDTVNSLPGSRGTIWLSDISLVKATIGGFRP